MSKLHVDTRNKFYYKSNMEIAKSKDIELNPGPTQSFKLISLNCRGLSNRDKVRSLISALNKLDNKDVTVIMLQETMIEKDDYVRLIYKHNLICTPGTGAGRGCITLIRGVDATDIEHFSEQRGHRFKITIEDEELTLINAYAPNTYNERKIRFFEEIIAQTQNDDKVIIAGDLNITFNDKERIGMCRSSSEKNTALRIQALMDRNGYIDLWDPDSTDMTRRNPDGTKQSRLDRILTKNVDVLLPTKTIWNITNTDHAAVYTETQSKNTLPNFHKIITNMRYYNSKTARKKFKKEFDARMTEVQSMNEPSPQNILEYAKVLIRTLYEDKMRKVIKNTNIETKVVNEELQLLQEKIELKQNSPLENARLEILTQRLNEITERQGKINAEKLRQKWIDEGEKSTKYFLNLLKSKGKQTSIKELETPKGLTKNETDINEEVTNFYKNLYESDITIDHEIVEEMVKNLPKPKETEKDILNSPITDKELFRTLRRTKDSAPGPDGITYSYYKFLWGSYKEIIINAWNDLMEGNSPPKSWQESTLTLLPKKDKNRKELKNWRPITLSNCDIKLISKTLSQRVTECLKDTIKHHQTAYMTNRSISDNLRIINIASTIAETEQKTLYILSLDAKKAFDSVSHEAISYVLTALGLEKFERIFHKLYQNQKVHILNGKTKSGQYTIRRGVKQGDALSCVLFILLMELVLTELNQAGLEKFKYKTTVLPTAIAYADDVTVILTNNADIQKVFTIYDRFRKATGLELNADKTEIFAYHPESRIHEIKYNNQEVTLANQDEITINGLILRHSQEERYTKNWNKVLEKMKIQYASWVPRNLSLMGKIQIIKTFGYSQVLYLSRVIPPTQQTAAKIKKLTNHYIWTKSMAGNPAPNRIKQTIMEKPKLDGGFGLTPVSEIIERMNYLQVVINDREKSLGSTINSSLCNIFSINPTPGPFSDGILKNFCKISNKMWKDRLEIGLQGDEEDILRQTKVFDILLESHKRGIAGFLTKRKNENLIDIDYREILSKVKPEYRLLNSYVASIRTFRPNKEHSERIITPLTYSDIPKMKREMKTPKEQATITELKSGYVLEGKKARTIYKKIHKNPSVWGKTLTLRFLHGDMPYNTKYFKTNYSDTPYCAYCGETEDFTHKYELCDRLSELNCLIMDITKNESTCLANWILNEKTNTKSYRIIPYLIRHIEDFKSNKIAPHNYYKEISKVLKKQHAASKKHAQK